MATHSFSRTSNKYNNTLAPKSSTYKVQSTTKMQPNITSISPTKFPAMSPTDIQTTTTSNAPTKHPSIITLETTPTDAIGLLQFAFNLFPNVITFSKQNHQKIQVINRF